MDTEFGPDNALYVLEYGTGYFAELPAAQLARIDYVRNGQYTPVVRGSATPSSGMNAPLTVQFSSAGTQDAERRPPGLHVGLRLQRDRRFPRSQPDAHLHRARRLRGRAARDRSDRALGVVAGPRHVGNQAPQVALSVVSTTPAVQLGDTVNFTVTVTDDQPVDCARVSVAYILGHEKHGHPQTSTAGCKGEIAVPIDEAHAGAANISAVFVATYSDNPGGGEPPQQGSAEVRLAPPAPPGNQG